jgi:hypothetical protein
LNDVDADLHCVMLTLDFSCKLTAASKSIDAANLNACAAVSVIATNTHCQGGNNGFSLHRSSAAPRPIVAGATAVVVTFGLGTEQAFATAGSRTPTAGRNPAGENIRERAWASTTPDRTPCSSRIAVVGYGRHRRVSAISCDHA